MQTEITPEIIKKVRSIIGKANGKQGGLAKAKKMTKKERSEHAKKMANKRWENKMLDKPSNNLLDLEHQTSN